MDLSTIKYIANESCWKMADEGIADSVNYFLKSIEGLLSCNLPADILNALTVSHSLVKVMYSKMNDFTLETIYGRVANYADTNSAFGLFKDLSIIYSLSDHTEEDETNLRKNFEHLRNSRSAIKHTLVVKSITKGFYRLIPFTY